MSRYIDADALVEYLRDVCEELDDGNRDMDNSFSMMTFRAMHEFIDLQHTANVRENVRGEWKTEEDYDGDILYTCSVCGEPWCTIEGTPSDNHMNYCPNCGALMSESLKWAEIGKAFAEGLNEGLNCDAERSEE